MRSIVSLVSLLVLGSWSPVLADERETEWVHALHLPVLVPNVDLSDDEATARAEARFSRACDDRLAQVLRALTAPRVAWRREQARPVTRGDETRLVGELHAVVITPVAPDPATFPGVLLGRVRPGAPLALYRVSLRLDDTSLPPRVPTEAAAAGSLTAARTRARRVERARAGLLAQAQRVLDHPDVGVAWSGVSCASIGSTEPASRDEEWVVTRLVMEAVLVAPDARFELRSPPPLRPALEKLAVLGGACPPFAPPPQAEPAPQGFTRAVDRAELRLRELGER